MSIKGDSIVLETADMLTIRVKLNHKKIVQCIFLGNKESQTLTKLTCVDCGDEAARWLSRYKFKDILNTILHYVQTF